MRRQKVTQERENDRAGMRVRQNPSTRRSGASRPWLTREIHGGFDNRRERARRETIPAIRAGPLVPRIVRSVSAYPLVFAASSDKREDTNLERSLRRRLQ